MDDDDVLQGREERGEGGRRVTQLMGSKWPVQRPGGVSAGVSGGRKRAGRWIEAKWRRKEEEEEEEVGEAKAKNTTGKRKSPPRFAAARRCGRGGGEGEGDGYRRSGVCLRVRTGRGNGERRRRTGKKCGEQRRAAAGGGGAAAADARAHGGHRRKDEWVGERRVTVSSEGGEGRWGRGVGSSGVQWKSATKGRGEEEGPLLYLCRRGSAPTTSARETNLNDATGKTEAPACRGKLNERRERERARERTAQRVGGGGREGAARWLNACARKSARKSARTSRGGKNNNTQKKRR